MTAPPTDADIKRLHDDAEEATAIFRGLVDSVDSSVASVVALCDLIEALPVDDVRYLLWLQVLAAAKAKRPELWEPAT